jgi:hypothetical protein
MAPFDLPVGESRRFAAEPTPPPPWSKDQADGWHRQYDGTPLRLTVTCRRDGVGSWTLKYEIPLVTPPRVRFT